MLRRLKLMPSQFKASGYVPPIMQPLVEAAEKGLDLEPAIREITHRLGFESFMYGICLDPSPANYAHQFVYTTLPMQWIKIYDERGYIEIDPRIKQIGEAALPIIWDQRTYRGKSKKVDRFMDDCVRFGVGSGALYPIHDAFRRPAVMSLSMPFRRLSLARSAMIKSNLAAGLMFGQCIHEFLMVPALRKLLGPPIPVPRLTPRERECLILGAKGLSSKDISRCMSITVRTVQMHFDSVRLKLGAANRQEAVALAIKRGIIVV